MVGDRNDVGADARGRWGSGGSPYMGMQGMHDLPYSLLPEGCSVND